MSKKATSLPAVTPFQFIALLDELCAAGFAEMGEKKGVPFYQIAISGIQKGAAILEGKGKRPAALIVSAAQTTPSLTPLQFVTMLDEICNVDDATRRRHATNEVYMMTAGDVIEGLERVFRSRPG